VATSRAVYLRPSFSLLLGVWGELRVSGEWLRLKTTQVFGGAGVRRGDGRGIILVPGFLGSDNYLNDLYRWLLRIGYKPYFANFGRNSECPEILTQKLVLTINKVYEETARKVVIIGHSLGGTIAIAATMRRSGKVSKIITLGSPIHNAGVNPLVFVTASVLGSFIRTRGNRLENCYTDRCSCQFVRSLPKPPPKGVEAAAIYTRGDRAVRWQCTVWNKDEGCNFAVKGTHIGLAFNPEVYRAIADILSGETAGRKIPLLKVVT